MVVLSWLWGIVKSVLNGIAKVIVFAVLLLLLLIGVSLFSGDGLPGNMVLELDLRKAMDDKTSLSLLDLGQGRLSIMDVVFALDSAARDPRDALDGLLQRRGHAYTAALHGQPHARMTARYDPWLIEMVRAMAKQAESEREKRAKIIHASGEFEASKQLTEAAEALQKQPVAIHLRYLQTLPIVDRRRIAVMGDMLELGLAGSRPSPPAFPGCSPMIRRFTRGAYGCARLDGSNCCHLRPSPPSGPPRRQPSPMTP